jgi:hypothetical protein
MLELHFALLQYGQDLPTTMEDMEEQTELATKKLKLLEDVTKKIFAYLRPRSNLPRSPEEYSGFLILLDLLPTIVTVASSLETHILKQGN